MTQQTPSNRAQSSSGGGGKAEGMLASVLDYLRLRLELVLIEAEEQKWRFLEMLIWLLIMSVMSLIVLMLLVALTIVLLPGPWRVLGMLAWIVGGSLVLLLGVFRLREYARHTSPMFPETMEQIKKDQACFSDRT